MGARQILTVLGTILGLQALRAFFPLLVYVLRDRFGVSPFGLAGVGIVIFATAFPLPRLLARLGPGRAVATTALLLAVSRGTLQVWVGEPAVSLALAALSVVAFLAFLAAISRDVGLPRTPFLVGVLLDAVVHAVAGTRDLHWGGTFSDLAAWLLIAPALFLSLRSLREPAPPAGGGWSHGFGLLAWGPFLFLHLEWFGNVARLSARTTLPTGSSGTLLALGLAAGILLARHLPRRGFWAGAPALLLVSTFFGRGLIWSGVTGPLAPPTLLVVQLGGFALLARCFSGGTPWPRGAAETLAFGGGFLLFFGLLFAHYGGYILPLPLSRTVLFLLAGALLLAVSIAVRPTPQGETPAFSVRASLALILLALFPLLRPMLAQGLSTHTAPSLPTTAARGPIRVVTFNLHAGFDERGAFAYSEMLDHLREVSADLIALQEVSRGWVINGSADLFELAREELGMIGYPAPSSGFDWGNALFCRQEPESVEVHAMPPDDLLLKRSVLVADFVSPRLKVFATHYHHRKDGPEIRSTHSRFLVSLAGEEDRTTPSVLLGDFNSLPDSEPMAILARAGWRDGFDSSDVGRRTWPSADPIRRIDTILVKGPIDLDHAEVARPWGSDHRAVLAELFPEASLQRGVSP